jgi:hypothetical protein
MSSIAREAPGSQAVANCAGLRSRSPAAFAPAQDLAAQTASHGGEQAGDR